MQKHLENVKKIGRKIDLDDDKGYSIAIVIALIVISTLVAVYYVNSLSSSPEGYSTIYLLDFEKKAVSYPGVMVANQNSTFNVWVAVENKMGNMVDYQIQIKITKNLITFPVDSEAINIYEITLENGDSWEHLVTITQNEVGNYAVVFELWGLEDSGLHEFTHNFCVLNIQVIN
jgi:uncharacterized membrane protein